MGALATREAGEGLFRALRRTLQCGTLAKWTTLTLLSVGVPRRIFSYNTTAAMILA